MNEKETLSPPLTGGDLLRAQMSQSKAGFSRRSNAPEPAQPRARLMDQGRTNSARVPLYPDGPLLPAGYPSVSQWSSNETPPGSAYSELEWRQARQPEGSSDTYYVFELQTRAGSVLINRAKPAVKIETRVVDGQVVRQQVSAAAELDSPSDVAAFAHLLDGTLVVQLDEKTTGKESPFISASDGCVYCNGQAVMEVIHPRTSYMPDGAARSLYLGSIIRISINTTQENDQVEEKTDQMNM